LDKFYCYDGDYLPAVIEEDDDAEAHIPSKCTDWNWLLKA